MAMGNHAAEVNETNPPRFPRAFNRQERHFVGRSFFLPFLRSTCLFHKQTNRQTDEKVQSHICVTDAS